jgi:hypothetical protein
LDEAYEQGLSLPQKFPQALLLKEQAARSMSEVLEHLRQDQFDQARKKLRDLEKLLADLPEQFLSRTLYNRACVESAYAEGLSKKDANRAVALEEASRDLGEWLKIGLGGAWAREGKTERNEIHRMGSDSDLGCLLAERRSVILSKIPEEFRTALPQKLPKRRWGGGGGGGGGGCIPGHALIQTPLGLTPAACLREGDQITSLALGSRPLPVTTRVAQVHASRAPECILLNDTLMFTSSQPLYLYVGGLILAGDVEVGMDLLGSTALPISVKEKRTVPGYYEVYNLSTDHQTHNYVAYDSILCHNDKS